MSARIPRFSLAMLLALAAGSCAAPIKALMSPPAKPDLADAKTDAEKAPTPLQQALEKKAAAMRAKRPGPAPDVPRATTPNRVAKMLARARSAGPAKPIIPETPSPLARQFQVKAETRLSTQPAAMPSIRFKGQSTELSSEGNTTLATLLRKADDPLKHRLLVIGGLAGEGQPWQRMQLAGGRIDTIARHVPPPMQVEKRFDPALGLGEIRLELIEVRS